MNYCIIFSGSRNLSDLDAIAYIPLICTALAALVLCVFLIVIKIRRTAKVSFISFLSLGILIAGCIHTIFNPSMMVFALYLLAATVLFAPYCIMLAFGKEKAKKEKTAKSSLDEAKENPTVIKEIPRTEIDLLETGRGFIIEAADGFSQKEGFQQLLDSINKSVMSLTHAEGGAILLVDDFDDIVSVKSFAGDFPPPYKLPSDLPHKPIRVSTNFKFSQFPFHDNIFGDIVKSGKPELIKNSITDDRIFQNSPEEFLKTGSYVIVPMKLRDTVIGLIALARKAGAEPFSETEFNATVTLSEFAAAAVKSMFSFQEFVEHTELTKETSIACRIQGILIPKKLPVLPGISLGSFTDQSSGVCGDLYDIIPSRRDRISFIMADVAGKGMNSLIIMVMIRAMLRLIVNTTQSAGTILGWANRGICAEMNIDHFASVALINYDPVKHHMQIATGGTTPVYHFSAAKNAMERVSVSCEPIGVEKATVYKDIDFTVQTGDIVVTFSDGLIEALNESGQQYSIESLSKIIKAQNKLPGKEIANQIKSDIKKFIGTEKLHDDQTLLVVKIQ